MREDTPETLAALDLRIANLMVVGHSEIVIAQLIFRSPEFVIDRMAQPGFEELLLARREALTKQTIEGLVAQTHRLGAATTDAIDGLRDTAVHGEKASERTRASTTIITLYLRCIKELAAQQYKKDKAAKDAAKSSATSKQKKSKEDRELDGLLDLHISTGSSGVSSSPDKSTESTSQPAAPSKPTLPVKESPVSDDVPETSPASPSQGGEKSKPNTLPVEKTRPVEDKPPVETVPEIEITPLADEPPLTKLGRKVFEAISMVAEHPPRTPEEIDMAENIVRGLERLSIRERNQVTRMLCRFEEELMAAQASRPPPWESV